VNAIGKWLALAAALALSACPGSKGKGDADEPKPPPFRTDVNPGDDFGDPPAPDAGKLGLAYLEALYPKLRDGWRTFVSDCRLRLPPSDALNDNGLAVAIDFTVARDGRLVAMKVARSSGDQRFDATAQEVVREAVPFPSPPAALVSDDDTAHLSWQFARDHRLAGVASAQLTLVEWAPERAIPKLLDLGDVTGAAERLVRFGERNAAGTNAPEALVALGGAVAGAALVEALKHEDKGVQRLAMAAAAELGVGSVAPLVLGIAQKAVDKGLRIDAIAALGGVGDKSALPFLTSLLDGKKGAREATAVELAAARSLAALGKGGLARVKLALRLESHSEEERLSALAVLARFSASNAAEVLAEMLTSKGTSRATRQAVCAALGSAATKAKEKVVHKALRVGLGSRDAAVRAACALGVATASRAGVPAGRVTYWKLVKLLKDRDERVRAGALIAAVHVDPKRFSKELYAVVRDRSTAVRAALAEGLGFVPGPAAYTRLATLAKSSEVDVRRKAAAALFMRPEKQAREMLAGMISDNDPAVRRVALQAIEGADALASLVDDPDAELGAAALARLVAVRGKPAMLTDLFARLAQAPAGSAARVRVAAAWLAR